MNAVLINGSPKGKNSTSQFLAEQLEILLYEKCSCSHITASSNFSEISDYQVELLQNTDCVIFVFPLYFDAVPSHLFQLLPQLKKHLQNKDITVYAIVNCGFYEGKQTYIAIDIIKNWCAAANIKWGQGLGIGAGEIIPFNIKVPLGHGTMKNLGQAMSSISQNIMVCKPGKDIFISPNFPRAGYILASTILKWHPIAKKNNIKTREIKTAHKNIYE